MRYLIEVLENDEWEPAAVAAVFDSESDRLRRAVLSELHSYLWIGRRVRLAPGQGVPPLEGRVDWLTIYRQDVGIYCDDGQVLTPWGWSKVGQVEADMAIWLDPDRTERSEHALAH